MIGRAKRPPVFEILQKEYIQKVNILNFFGCVFVYLKNLLYISHLKLPKKTVFILLILIR